MPKGSVGLHLLGELQEEAHAFALIMLCRTLTQAKYAKPMETPQMQSGITPKRWTKTRTSSMRGKDWQYCELVNALIWLQCDLTTETVH